MRLLSGLMMMVGLALGFGSPAALAQQNICEGMQLAPAPSEVWDSNWGPLALDLTNMSSIKGLWSQGDGMVGQLCNGSYDSGSRLLQFDYYQDWNQQTGHATLVLSADGRQMVGSWSQQPDGTSGDWTATLSTPSMLLSS